MYVLDFQLYIYIISLTIKVIRIDNSPQFLFPKKKQNLRNIDYYLQNLIKKSNKKTNNFHSIHVQKQKNTQYSRQKIKNIQIYELPLIYILKAINNILQQQNYTNYLGHYHYQLMYNNNTNITTSNPATPNTNPQSTTPKANPNLNIISLFQKQLTLIPAQILLQLSRKIYPVQNHPYSTNINNPYHALYRNVLNYFVIQFNRDKKITYEEILAEVIKTASFINEGLCNKLSQMLKRQDVKIRFIENIKKYGGNVNGSATTNSSNIGGTSLLSTLSNTNKNQSKKSFVNLGSALIQKLGNNYTSDPDNVQIVSGPSNFNHSKLGTVQLNDTFKKPTHSTVNQVQDLSAIVAQKYMKQKIQVQNLLKRMQFQKCLTSGGKIENKKCLICQNILIKNPEQRKYLNSSGQFYLQKYLYKCQDCNEIFHKKCMTRDNNCAFCQLKNMNPLQKMKVQLFVGVLKKGIRKHQLQFQLTKAHTSQTTQNPKGTTSTEKNKKPSTFIIPTIQVRSIRLKDQNDPVSNFINLFPDSCTIMVNNRIIKEFQPLHKQSSLKYRRDECLKISTNANIGMNRIVVTERISKKDIKPQQRVQPENHLVGIYLVQNLQVPKQANKLEQFLTKSGYITGNHPSSVQKFLENIGSKLSQFQQSQSLLKKNLFIPQKVQQSSVNSSQMQQQEIMCQSIKVPLICSLTLQKMKFPGRTIFCKHFACFDVYNFILLNSQARLPKWQCPICKASAYKFVIDSIIHSIVSQLTKTSQQKKITKENQLATEIELNTNFEIKYFNSQGNILINRKNKIQQKNKNHSNTPTPNTLQIIQTEAIPYWIRNIYDLPIEGKNKRIREQEIFRQKQLQREKQKRLCGPRFIENQQSDIKIVEIGQRKLNIVSENDNINTIVSEVQQQKPVITSPKISNPSTPQIPNLKEFKIIIQNFKKQEKNPNQIQQQQKQPLYQIISQQIKNPISQSQPQHKPQSQNMIEQDEQHFNPIHMIFNRTIQKQPIKQIQLNNRQQLSISQKSQRLSESELQIQNAIKQYQQRRNKNKLINANINSNNNTNNNTTNNNPNLIQNSIPPQTQNKPEPIIQFSIPIQQMNIKKNNISNKLTNIDIQNPSENLNIQKDLQDKTNTNNNNLNPQQIKQINGILGIQTRQAKVISQQNIIQIPQQISSQPKKTKKIIQDNLFKTYNPDQSTTRRRQKSKNISNEQYDFNNLENPSNINVNININMKEKIRKKQTQRGKNTKSKNQDKEFVVPEDANIIQLSD